MSMWVTVATIYDSPHLTPEKREAMLAKIPANMRKVRAEGMPTYGAGLVWPVVMSDVTIPRFSLPIEFYRSFALDTGWNGNGCVFGAEDRSNGTIYIYDCFQKEHVQPPIVAAAVMNRGNWLHGVADAKGVNQNDGKQYFDIYKGLGLKIEIPNRALESGLTMVWNMLSTGKIRIFEDCTPLIDCIQIYMRDKNGKVKEGQNDHLADALRHLIFSGTSNWKQPPRFQMPEMDWSKRPAGGAHGWMAN